MRAAPLKVGMMIDTDLASMGHPLAGHAAGGVANNTSLGTMDDRWLRAGFSLGNAQHQIGSSRRLEDSAPQSCLAAAAFEERECFFRVGIRARDTSIE